MATVLLGATAIIIFVLAAVLISRGDEIAQRLLNGPRNTPTMTDSAASTASDDIRPIDADPSASTAPSTTGVPASATTDAAPSTEVPEAPPSSDGCTAQAYWEASRPPDLAGMTVTGARCVGAYGLVSLAQPESTPDAEPPQLYIALRTVGDGWGIIATQTELDCASLQQLDPQVPAELCG